MSAHSRPRSNRWLITTIGLILASCIPMGIHELMISGLGVPYPASDAVPKWVVGINTGISSLTLLFALYLSRESFRRRELWLQCLGVSLAAAAISETFRVVFMNGLVTTAYAFNLLIALPLIVCLFLLFSGITIVARMSARTWLKAGIVLALVILFSVLEPLVEAKLALETRFASLSHPEIYTPPYGWAVNFPSILTFIEPVLGLLAAYVVFKDRLGRTPATRLLTFVVLVLLFRKILFKFFFYGFFSPLGYGGFLFAMSQFLFEWIAVALLVGGMVELMERTVPSVPWNSRRASATVEGKD